MKNSQKWLIVSVIGLSLITGYTLRIDLMLREQVNSTVDQNQSIGTRVVTSELDATGVDLRPAETLIEVLKNVNNAYVEQIKPSDEAKMTYDLLKVMLGSLLDQNTRFIEPQERKIIEDSYDGKFHGIGAVSAIKQISKDGAKEEHLIIISVVDGGPASKAGIVSGDDIISIDGRSVLPYNPFERANIIYKNWKSGPNSKNRGMIKKQLDKEQKRIDKGISIVEAESMLESSDGKDIELNVIKLGSKKEVTIKLKSEEFVVNPMIYKIIDDKYAYIKINAMTRDVADKFAEALRDAKKKNVEGMILDLSNVFGGDTRPAVLIASHFIPETNIGSVLKARGKRLALKTPVCSPEETWNKKLVVVVNKGTARTAEILSLSLKEIYKAQLIGQTTSGDTSYVSLFDLGDGSAVSVSTGAFVDSKGHDFKKGVSVDIKLTPFTQKNDNMIIEAKKLLKG